MKTALISGITGQDGSYLTELLLEKGYLVHGIIRRSSSFNTFRIDHLYNNPEFLNKRLFLHYGDLTDSSNLNRLVERIHPDEIYNLGAQSHVQVSFEVPEYTAEVDGVGTLRFLDAIRETRVNTKFYQASTSELYGKAAEIPQDEKTPFYPRSPYAAAKLYAYWITVNLNAKRDWGYAPDFVEGMWRILQTDKPGDYVLATGETHTVREFVEETFSVFNEEIIWEGTGVDEKGFLRANRKEVIEIDPRYFRPTEVDLLVGNPSKAKEKLGWEPKVTFKELVRIMAIADYEKIKNRL